MGLAPAYGDEVAARWANAAHANHDRAASAIANNGVWVIELESNLAGWVEVRGATIESLYVRATTSGRGIGSSLLAHAERQIEAAGEPSVYLDASPNAEAFYARRGYRRIGESKPNNSIPMMKSLAGDEQTGETPRSAGSGT